MTRTVRVTRATDISSRTSRTRLEPGLYAAHDSGKIVTLTPSDESTMQAQGSASAKTVTITSVEFALLLNSHDLVYVSW